MVACGAQERSLFGILTAFAAHHQCHLLPATITAANAASQATVPVFRKMGIHVRIET
jgi:hypothetical protein